MNFFYSRLGNAVVFMGRISNLMIILSELRMMCFMCVAYFIEIEMRTFLITVSDIQMIQIITETT